MTRPLVRAPLRLRLLLVLLAPPAPGLEHEGL